jgi:cobalt-zinc-cadmium efflux system protein
MAHSHGARGHGPHAHGAWRQPSSAGHAHVHASHGKFTAREAHQAGRLGTVLAIAAAFFVLELAGALAADSVVLQAAALHLLTDILALAISLVAMRVAVRRPTPRFTYGLRRVEPVAAIFSAFLVLATTVGIVFEGIEALHQRTPPKAGLMLVFAVGALLVNGVSAWLLHDASRPHGGVAQASGAGGHALNLRGASLHLAGDTLGAFAAVCAALVIRFGGSAAADPIASFVVAAILVYGSALLLRDAALVLLEAAPAHLPIAAIRRAVAEFPGVTAVRDLHVWALGAGHDAVTVHVHAEAPDGGLAAALSARIRAEFGVEYCTVQVEPHEGPPGASAHPP